MMPAYNSHETVRESVESVLAQTVPDLEIVVVDDGSETPIADALAHVRDERLRIVRHERNRGIHTARNTALGLARSPFVSQLDSDDLWEPDYLESVLPHLDDPAVGLVYANVGVLHHPDADRTIGILDPTGHPIDSFPRICDSCPVPSATPTMRTEAVRAVGGYAEWLRHTADYHLYLKLARAGWRFAYVHRPLATYRWPQAHRGASHDRRGVLRDHVKMWAGFVLRHPLTPGPRRQLRWALRRLAGRPVRRG
jgi:glycosyltransferase involved in cell wall biosynthesis